MLRAFEPVDTFGYSRAYFSITLSLKVVDTEAIDVMFPVETFFLFSRDSSVDLLNLEEKAIINHRYAVRMFQGQSDTTIKVEIISSTLSYYAGFKPGEKLYCRGFVYPAALRYYYFDPYINQYKIVMCSPNRTEARLLTMP